MLLINTIVTFYMKKEPKVLHLNMLIVNVRNAKFNKKFIFDLSFMRKNGCFGEIAIL